MPMDITGLEALVASNPDALALVKDLGAKAGKLTPELEAELPKLTEYKGSHAAIAKLLEATKAKDPDTLITDFGNLKNVNADLIRQRDTWKNSGDKVDKAEYLALQEKITANENAMKVIQDKLTAAETEKATSAAAQREADLKASVVSAASKGKATDAEDVFILLKARGLTGFKEDGKPFFNKLNDAGQAVACATADEMVTAFLAKRKDLVSGSGTGGTGGGHQGGADDKALAVTTRAEARAAFKAARAPAK